MLIVTLASQPFREWMKSKKCHSGEVRNLNVPMKQTLTISRILFKYSVVHSLTICWGFPVYSLPRHSRRLLAGIQRLCFCCLSPPYL